MFINFPNIRFLSSSTAVWPLVSYLLYWRAAAWCPEVSLCFSSLEWSREVFPLVFSHAARRSFVPLKLRLDQDKLPSPTRAGALPVCHPGNLRGNNLKLPQEKKKPWRHCLLYLCLVCWLAAGSCSSSWSSCLTPSLLVPTPPPTSPAASASPGSSWWTTRWGGVGRSSHTRARNL